MRDLIFYKLLFLPIILLFLIIGIWMYKGENDLSQDDFTLISGIIAPEIRYGDVDGSKYISFHIDSSPNSFKISSNARDAIRTSFGLDKFATLLQVGNKVKMWVDIDDIIRQKQSINIGYLTIEDSVITQFEDLNLEREKDVSFGHKYYWVPLFLSIGIFFYALLDYEFPGLRKQLTIPQQIKMIDIESLKSYKIGEYTLSYDNQNQTIEIANEFITKIKIFLNERKLIHRHFFISVFTYFDDIEYFGLGQEKGEVDIYLRHKKGMSFSLLNTKSSGFRFLDPNRKEKEKIEIMFLSILNSVIAYPYS